MKHLTLIAVLTLSVCLLSCRTAKTTTDTTRDSTLSYIDTTVTRTDTAAIMQTDTAAVHTLKGIRAIRDHRHSVLAVDGIAARSAAATSIHHERHNGLAADSTSHDRTHATVTPPPRWYDSALTRLTLAAALALILYLLYRYLRRRAKS